MRKTILTLAFITCSFAPFAVNRAHAQMPDTVKVGCYFLSLHDFNFREKEFTARFWMWLVYDNPEIDFADGVEIPNAKMVNFDATVVDSLKNNKWVQLKITAVIKQNWSVNNYPFDKQELNVVIENSAYDSRTVVFIADTTGQHFDTDFVIAGWTITRFHVSEGTSHYSTGFGDTSLEKPESEYSKIIVEIDIERNAWGLFFKIFLGMYVSFAIAYISLWIDPEMAESRFALPVGGLFTAVGNKYIIDSYLPESSAFTMVDILHGLTFVMIFTIIFISVLALRYRTRQDLIHGKRVNSRLRNFLGICYVLVNALVVLTAIYM
jgi:hypothetical protein